METKLILIIDSWVAQTLARGSSVAVAEVGWDGFSHGKAGAASPRVGQPVGWQVPALPAPLRSLELLGSQQVHVTASIQDEYDSIP